MNIQKKSQKNTKKALIIAVSIVLIASCYGAFAWYKSLWPFGTLAQVPTDPNAISAKTDQPSPKNNNQPKQVDTSKSNDAVTQNTVTSQVPVSTNTTATITQLDQSDSNINFAMTVTNATAGGTCVVTFSSPNDRPITKEFASSSKGTSSFCSTSIAAYEFSYLGDWHVKAYYYNGNEQTTAEGNITIK